MGGCRCSFRSCAKSSDGKTHFFHYPVRDKVRCLTWMTNANRLDLQTLSVNQLKNKVICENHFSDVMFMNYKHERLTHIAVPTLDCGVIKEKNEPCPTEDLVNISGIKLHDMVYLPETDIPPTNKEVTTMTVNNSPITGLSFIPPHKKRPKTSAPYIELLTRQHTKVPFSNAIKMAALQTPKSIKSKIIKLSPMATLTPADTAKSKIPIKIKNNTLKEAISLPLIISNDEELGNLSDLFKTPPKFIPTDSTEQILKQSKIIKCPRKVRKTIEFNPNAEINAPSTEQPVVISDNVVIGNPIEQNNASNKIQIVCNEPYIDPTRNLYKENDITLITIPKSPNSVNASAPANTNSINIIHQQLLHYNKQNDSIRTCKTLLPKRVLPEIKKPTNNESTSEESNEYMRLIHENSKEIAELKRMLLEEKTEKRANLKRKFVSTEVRVMKSSKNLSKAGLYTQLVPHLSSKLALMVHAEMFPSIAKRSKRRQL